SCPRASPIPIPRSWVWQRCPSATNGRIASFTSAYAIRKRCANRAAACSSFSSSRPPSAAAEKRVRFLRTVGNTALIKFHRWGGSGAYHRVHVLRIPAQHDHYPPTEHPFDEGPLLA